MEYNSQKTDKSQEMRSSLFNTINLINDLESGNADPGRSSKRNMDKNVSLSDTFVSGVKDKLVDYSKAEKNIGHQPGIDPEKFTSAMQTIEKEINDMKKIIASNDDEIGSLKNTIAELKQRLKSAQDNTPGPTSQTQNDMFSSDVGEKEMDSYAHVDDSIFASAPSGEMSKQEDNSSESIFDPLKEDDGNLGISAEQTSLNEAPGFDTRSSDSSASVEYEPEIPAQSSTQDTPAQPIAAQVPETPKQQVSASNPNPRVGSYESNDVLIEKYFYYGNK